MPANVKIEVPMSTSVAELVDSIFRNHNGGEFNSGDVRGTYTVIGPSDLGRGYLFVTKPALVASTLKVLPPCGMIGRYGLPSVSDAQWLRELVGVRKLVFLGDMDPVDLLIYLSLRERVHPVQLVCAGVSDALLSALAIRVPESFTLKFSAEEEDVYLRHQPVFNSLASEIGEVCLAMLSARRKIELDAIVSMVGAEACVEYCAKLT